MNTNTYFGYLRVSTEHQGVHGVSLQEQKAAIEKHALDRDLVIDQCFEEQQSAARAGRPVFGKLVALLKAGQAKGVILHKIDRGARNLRDWVDLMDLVDLGVEVHLAGDDLDLRSRSGRLAADIQAVIAADYIRNLSEEAKKGLYGRLKQGLYPFKAPIGYRDQGSGRPKTIDPEQGEFVREAFRIFSGGGVTITALAEELTQRGLATNRGTRLQAKRLGGLLRNPWYMGTMLVKGQRFLGRHQPLISKELFEKVQAVLAGRKQGKRAQHRFLFQGLFRCGNCGYAIIAERQKGHIYYRCHRKTCKGSSLREERIEQQVLEGLRRTQALLDYEDMTVEGKRSVVAHLFGQRTVTGLVVTLRIKIESPNP